MLLKVPLNAAPIGVRAVETITASFIVGHADSEILRHYSPAKEKGGASIFCILIFIDQKIDTSPFSIPLLPLPHTYSSKARDKSSMTS
jgi:hypothetical protein